jgi:hypothetical protein
VPATLFLALATVYLVGVVGIVVAGSFVGEPDEVPVGLDERLAMVRATEPARRRTPRTAPLFDQDAAETPAPYYVRATPRR